MKITPTEGIHIGISNRTYHHEWDAVSRSQLAKLVAGMPGDLEHERQHPGARKVSREMLIGSLVDDLFYGADMGTIYAFAPAEFNARKKVDRLWKESMEQDGLRVVTAADLLLAENITQALWDSPLAREYLGMTAGDPLQSVGELPAQWQASYVHRDPDTGVLVKVRPDTVLTQRLAITDLKTTADSSPAGFQRAAENGRYHLQAAMYLDVVTAVTGEYDEFFWCVVSRDPPHRVEVYRCGETEIERGREQIRSALNLYAKCTETGHWPTSSGRVRSLEFRPWALK